MTMSLCVPLLCVTREIKIKPMDVRRCVSVCIVTNDAYVRVNVCGMGPCVWDCGISATLRESKVEELPANEFAQPTARVPTLRRAAHKRIVEHRDYEHDGDGRGESRVGKYCSISSEIRVFQYPVSILEYFQYQILQYQGVFRSISEYFVRDTVLRYCSQYCLDTALGGSRY